MNKETMRKHYEVTPKETLINILISSREQVDKLQKRNKECKQEIERLNELINELERDFERKIQSCTIEAETTTNDFYCRLHIATLKRWLNKIKELKGVDKE